MFDINAIVNAAIATAVEARITEVLQQHANIVGALEQRIAALSNLVQCIDTDRVRLTQRITALENNPAQGVDTTAQARLITADAFVSHLDNQEWFWEKISSFVAKAGGLSPDDVEAMIERALDDHCDTFNHDDYDRAVAAIDEVDLSDMVTTDNLPDLINDALSGATVSIRV